MYSMYKIYTICSSGNNHLFVSEEIIGFIASFNSIIFNIKLKVSKFNFFFAKLP